MKRKIKKACVCLGVETNKLKNKKIKHYECISIG